MPTVGQRNGHKAHRAPGFQLHLSLLDAGSFYAAKAGLKLQQPSRLGHPLTETTGMCHDAQVQVASLTRLFILFTYLVYMRSWAVLSSGLVLSPVSSHSQRTQNPGKMTVC